MSDQSSGRPAGWKKDPTGRHYGRYWDGTQWTANVISAEKVQSLDPLPPRPEPSIFADGPAPRPAAPPPQPRTVMPPEPVPRPAPPTITTGKGKNQVVAAIRGWPRWAQWALGILVVMVVIGAAASGESDKDKTVSAGPPATTTATADAAAKTTKAPVTTSTTAKPSREAQLLAYSIAFEKSRVGIADAIKSDNPGSVASVDRFELDKTGPTIVLSVTSGYSTAEFQRNAAWAVTKTMQLFWEAKIIASTPDAIPGFRLSLGSLRYECPHDFMVRLAQLRASREDWEATCRA